MTIIISLIASIYVLYLMHNPTNINFTDSDIMCLTGSPLVFEILHGHYDDLDNLTNNFVDGDLLYEHDIIVESLDDIIVELGVLDESLDEPEIVIELGVLDESLDEPEIVVELGVLDESLDDIIVELGVLDESLDEPEIVVESLDEPIIEQFTILSSVDDLLVNDLLVDDLLVNDLLVNDLLVDDLYGNFEDEYIELPLLYQANETRTNQYWATRTPISLLRNIPSRMTH